LVHGGAILTALDEALGAAAWVMGRPVMTARLTTEFRKGVPLGSTMLVETRFIRERHRLVLLEGTLSDDHGHVYAYADGRFMVLSEPDQKRILGRAA
jgi:acyl-coenzyme A thioesterase PaaI-like protein